MANIGTLTARLGLDTKDLRAGTGRARGMFSGLERSATGSMGAITASIGKMAAAFGVVMVGAKLVGAFKNMITIGADFEYTMATVGGVMRATGAEMKSLTDIAKKMGETTEWTASQSGDALKFLGMAGFRAAKAVEALPGVLDLATAGNLELGRAADIASNALTAMGLPVKALSRVNDVFVGTITRSNTNMEMMAESFKYAAPVAKAYGYSIEQLSGLIGKLGDAGIQGCYDDQTEVLTRRGWLNWIDINPDDEFATVNPETNHIEYQKPQRLIRYHYKGKMYLVTNQNVNLCVTPDHRMWVKPRRKKNYRFMTAKDVDGRAVRYQTGGLRWKGNDEAIHTLEGCSRKHVTYVKNIAPTPIDTKLWARFLGWYIAEGSCDHRRGTYRIRITQIKTSIRANMRVALKCLPWNVLETKDGFEIHSQQLYKAVAPLGKQPERYIPLYAKNWSPRLLKILFKSLIEGDGTHLKNVLSYITSSPKLRDDVSEIAIKIGYAVSTSLCFRAGHQRYFEREKRVITWKHDTWKVNIRKNQLYPWYSPYEYKGIHGRRLSGLRFPARSEWINYNGEVFCAEVPNHLLIVRRGRKVIVSGNSMAGTQLAMSFQKSSKIAKEFGFESSELVDVLEALRATGMETTEIMDLFGLRAGRAVGVLVDRIPEIREFQNTLTGVGGEAARLANIMRTTVKGSFAELKSVVESVAIDTFDRLASSIEDTVQSIITWIRRNKEEMVALFEVMAKSALAAATVITKLAGFVSDLASTTREAADEIDGLTDSVKDLKYQVDRNTDATERYAEAFAKVLFFINEVILVGPKLLDKLAQSTRSLGDALINVFTGGGPAAIDETADALERLEEWLGKVRTGFERATPEWQAWLEFEAFLKSLANESKGASEAIDTLAESQKTMALVTTPPPIEIRLNTELFQEDIGLATEQFDKLQQALSQKIQMLTQLQDIHFKASLVGLDEITQQKLTIERKYQQLLKAIYASEVLSFAEKEQAKIDIATLKGEELAELLKRFAREEQDIFLDMKNVMMQTSYRLADGIVDAIYGTRLELQKIWQAMARDFLSLFVRKILSELASTFAVEFLKILKFFDKAANDRMAMKQGERFVGFFSQGAQRAMAQMNLAPALAQVNLAPAIASAPVSGLPTSALSPAESYAPRRSDVQVVVNVNAPITSDEFVDWVVHYMAPIIERASEMGQTKIALEPFVQTGSADAIIN